MVTGNAHLADACTRSATCGCCELTRDQYDEICRADPELRAELLHLFMFAIQDDYDRVLRTLSQRSRHAHDRHLKRVWPPPGQGVP